MASLFNATTINQTPRYFFATKAEGEQDLFTQIGTVAGLSTFNVGITGVGGNLVQIDTMPQVNATEFVNGEGAVFAGTGSDYLTLSTINTTASGLSMSIDRRAGSGITSLENYGTNGQGGFEFLCRAVNSQLVSTTQSYMNNYLSSIGAEGAAAFLQPTGALNVSLGMTTPFYTSLQSQSAALRSHYGIQDLSGANGVTRIPRWTIGTSNLPTGGNVGTDWCLFAFDDVGSYLGNYLEIQRKNGAMNIQNISSVQNLISTGVTGTIFPANKTNVEFGEGTKVIAGASNQATPYVVLFSTPVSGLNPDTQSLININFTNAISTATPLLVNYKIGFSTATAYNNCLQTALVPGGQFTPSALPSANTPIGYTNICAMVDSDGLNPDGSGFLYVAGQLSDPNGVANQIYVKKGQTSEATRNAFVWRSV